MNGEVRFDERGKAGPAGASMLPFYSIADLAARWRCSRGTVYNILRGEKVLNFAPPGHKGKKLVSAEVVCCIEREHMRVLR